MFLTKVEGWDGYVLWLKATEDEAKRNYERNIPPDTSRYYTKDPPSMYNPNVLKGPTVIVPRYTRPVYTTATAGQEQILVKCDLCNSSFKTEDELAHHITTNH